MKNKMLLVALFAHAHYICGMVTQKLHVYAIPGQNGLGSEEYYVKDLLGHNAVAITSVQTPSFAPDFGQSKCVKYLRDAVALHENNQGSIIHATSQGTATAINYVAHEDKDKQIQALILEATLGSGNSAIHHTVSGPLMNMSSIANLPFSYYWMPYLSKVMFFGYWPAGKQAISSIKNISTDMPVVIAHSKNDPQLSYNDACALYYGLRERGNNNVYLISKDGRRHIQVLATDNDKQVVRAILKKHGLLEGDEQQNKMLDAIDLSIYQPDHKQFKNQYDLLAGKENNHVRLGYSLGAGVCAATYYVLKRICG